MLLERMMQRDDRVIVVGAGPVGAVTALALVKKGIPVTLIEAEAEPPEDQRAATIHPQTVEMLVELGLKDEAFAEDASGGMLSPVFHFRDRVSGELVAVFDLGLLEGEVPYPFVVQWEQYKLVRAAKPHIEASGIAEVRFSAKVTGLEQGADHVDVTTANAAGESEKIRGRYVIGADGGRSTVPVPPEESDEQALSMEGIQRRLQGIHPRQGGYEIPYHALYAVHQRVAATFNKGRVLLAGDSAHVNNPIGGMGMNGGIHDAMNLTAKLADVWFGRAEPDVFDRYTRQRRKAQVDYVQAQTIQNKKSLEEKDPVIRRQHLDELRRISEDVKLHKQFLYRAALIDSLNSANAVQ